MPLPDIKDLAKVIDLCRKKGVKTFTVGDISFELGEMPEKTPRHSSQEDEDAYDPADPWANFPAGELTPEQLTYYSAGGAPGEEPWKKGVEE